MTKKPIKEEKPEEKVEEELDKEKIDIAGLKPPDKVPSKIPDKGKPKKPDMIPAMPPIDFDEACASLALQRFEKSAFAHFVRDRFGNGGAVRREIWIERYLAFNNKAEIDARRFASRIKRIQGDALERWCKYADENSATETELAVAWNELYSTWRKADRLEQRK